MGWRERDYHRGGWDGTGSYLSNPANILGFSVPFGTWFGVRVRLHFWLLLSVLFLTVAALQHGSLVMLVIHLALLLASLLVHDFAHRWAAQRVGGDLHEFLLWPAGGIIMPAVPPRPGPVFFAHAAGMGVNLLLAALGLAAGVLWLGQLPVPLNPLAIFSMPALPGSDSLIDLAAMVLGLFVLINLGIVFINLLPYYWFDGGYVFQSILWPWLGLHRAINITCIVGMVLAVPMFLLALSAASLMGMIFWALLFSSAFTRRRQLQAAGTGELDDAIAQSAQWREEGRTRGRRWLRRRAAAAARTARRAEAHEAREERIVDAILAKVRDQGLPSLSWWERRALRKATEHQRQRDAERRF